jgi:dTDP-4-amino-4,6-dideoxygalactose transaminase
MYTVGREEIDAVRKVLESGKVFRYGIGGECSRFEERYAGFVGSSNCLQTASGTNALTAALIGAGIGPGDEVIVPACTYMATPIAVLAAGAIPVIVDIDESIGIDPAALETAIGPRTRAVIPVHMWGLACDMDAIMEISRRRGLIVIEDACQAVGGAYVGRDGSRRMLGSIGAVGAFSFNYYKNMTCGEGGAIVTDDPRIAERAMCAIDPCRFYWDGRENTFAGFVTNGARASEIEGAILNAQLDRIEGMIARMRDEKAAVLSRTTGDGLRAAPDNSPQGGCGTHVMYQFDAPAAAAAFAEGAGGTVLIRTGRHVYTEWDPILDHRGGPHPALNPYQMAENRECRMAYDRDMCARTLDILSRTVSVQMHPEHTSAAVDALVDRVLAAAAGAEEAAANQTAAGTR